MPSKEHIFERIPDEYGWADWVLSLLDKQRDYCEKRHKEIVEQRDSILVRKYLRVIGNWK